MMISPAGNFELYTYILLDILRSLSSCILTVAHNIILAIQFDLTLSIPVT